MKAITIDTDNGESRVTLMTSIDGSNAHLLLAALQPLVQRGDKVIIDLRHCESMTSKGLAVLLEIHRLTSAEARLVARNVNTAVRELMILCGVDRLINVEGGGATVKNAL